jgi:hypothetical protein
MSASWDRDQKIKFVFSNLYETYRKGREAARRSEVEGDAGESISEKGRVLQAAQVRPGLTMAPGWTVRPEWAIREHRPVEFIQVRRGLREREPLESPRVVPGRRAPAPAAAPLPSAETVSRLQAALSGRKAPAPLAKLERNLDELRRLQKRIGFLLREIEVLSKGTRRD